MDMTFTQCMPQGHFTKHICTQDPEKLQCSTASVRVTRHTASRGKEDKLHCTYPQLQVTVLLYKGETSGLSPQGKNVDHTVTSSILQTETALCSVTMVPSAKLHGVTFRRLSSY